MTITKPQQIEYKSRIYIWETRRENSSTSQESSVGHVALEVIKDKNGEEKIKNYLSLRPKYGISVNPLTLFFPVPACNFMSLKEDIDLEGKFPDRIYEIPLDKHRFAQLNEQIRLQQISFQENKTWYQLMPRFNTFNLLKLVAVKDIPESSHCALAVRRALLSTGHLIPITYFPWKITPTDLGNYLESSRFTRIYPPENH